MQRIGEKTAGRKAPAADKIMKRNNFWLPKVVFPAILTYFLSL